MSLDVLLSKGKVDSKVSSDPAANTEASISVTGTWIIVAARVTVAQGATQTPLPSLTISDSSGNVIGSYPGASAATSASTTSTFDWHPGATLTAGAGATTNRAPIPQALMVKSGWTVATSTAGKGANTDISALALHIIRL